MANYTHVKHLLDFYGVDLRSSDMLRGRGFSSDGTENVVHTPMGGITARWGSHIINSNSQGHGLAYFASTDIAGTSKETLVRFSSTPSVLTRGYFYLTNNHATDDAYVYHYYDDTAGEFVFKITRGGVDIVNEGLGMGTEGTPYYLSDLETVVDAAGSITMTSATTMTSAPAAFMELLNGSMVEANGGQLNIYFYLWTAITGDSAYVDVAGYTFTSSTQAYETTSHALVGGVLYYTSGCSTFTYYLCKYDGNRAYRAGMPPIQTVAGIAEASVATGAKTDDIRGDTTIGSGSSGTMSDGYLFRYVNIDKAGNRVEGPIYDGRYQYTTNYASGTVLRISNLSSTDSVISAQGFNSAYATVSGAQNNVSTITVTAGHSMQAGDVAFFYDASQSRYIQRVVTATTSTTITISTTSLDSDTLSDTYDDGGTVNVRNDCLITNNARLMIFRHGAPDTSTYYLVAEVPNWLVTGSAFAVGTFAYYDTMSDATLLTRPPYIEDEYPHDLPPISCKYLTEYNGGLVAAGSYKNPRAVYFSDVDGPEYWPEATHNFELPRDVTGVKGSGEFLISATGNSIHATSGVLSEFNFRVDQIGHNIGVTSHWSMQEIEEGVLCFSSNVGPYVLFSGRKLEPLGALSYPDGAKVSRLEPFWTRRYSTRTEYPDFSRAMAAVLPDDKLYVLYIPYLDPTATYPRHPTANSICWVFDYGRGAWWKWTGLNMGGGMAEWGGTLYWQTRYTASPAVNSRVYQLQMDATVDEYNYNDHGSNYTFTWRSHWESLGEPAAFKRFLRCRISSHETRAASTTPLDLNTYVDYSTSSQSNDDTLSWTTQKDLKPKLKAETCRAMMVEFTSTVMNNPPLISGYELEAVAPFRPEMKE